MKDKIKQAGFKNQRECYKHLEICKTTMQTWCNKPEKCPKLFSDYLDTRKENKALKNLLEGYLHPDS